MDITEARVDSKDVPLWRLPLRAVQFALWPLFRDYLRTKKSWIFSDMKVWRNLPVPWHASFDQPNFLCLKKLIKKHNKKSLIPTTSKPFPYSDGLVEYSDEFPDSPTSNRLIVHTSPDEFSFGPESAVWYVAIRPKTSPPAQWCRCPKDKVKHGKGSHTSPFQTHKCRLPGVEPPTEQPIFGPFDDDDSDLEPSKSPVACREPLKQYNFVSFCEKWMLTGSLLCLAFVVVGSQHVECNGAVFLPTLEWIGKSKIGQAYAPIPIDYACPGTERAMITDWWDMQVFKSLNQFNDDETTTHSNYHCNVADERSMKLLVQNHIFVVDDILKKKTN